jgi:hypothetical protein
MLKVINLLNGKKVYIVAIATIVYAVLGLALKQIDFAAFIGYLVVAGNAIGFRSALNKVQVTEGTK